MTNSNANELPDTIIINSARLELLLGEYHNRMERRTNWLAPLSFALACILCIVVSDFKDVLGLGADIWKGIVYTLTFISLVWLGFEIYWAQKAAPLDILKSDINRSILNIPEYTAMFVMRLMEGNVPKILVVKNREALFLPYVHFDPRVGIHDQNEKILASVSQFLGVQKESVYIEHIPDVRLPIKKLSVSENIEKLYNFEFFSCSVAKNDASMLLQEKFCIGMREFSWVTLAQLESHQETMERNRGVVKHLRVRYISFFVDTAEAIK